MTNILQRRPLTEPVTVETLAGHLRLENPDVIFLSSLIVSARTVIEAQTGCRLLAQLWSQVVDGQPHGEIMLHHWPIIEIKSVSILGNTRITLSPDRYDVVAASRPARLRPMRGGWPNLRPSQQGLSVDLVAGFGQTAEDVPDSLRHAVLLLAAHWYESDEWNTLSSASALPDVVLKLVDPFRLLRMR